MIEKLVAELSRDPFNAKKNFACAVEYEKLGQKFSAISFYLRAVEYGYDQNENLIVYTSLLKTAKCLEVSSERDYSISNCLLQAIAYDSLRPEAYFLLSQYYENKKNWQESYTMACIGLDNLAIDDLPIDVGYYGKYCLEFQKGVAAYWVHRKQEAIDILNKLREVRVRPEYAQAIKNNLERIKNEVAV